MLVTSLFFIFLLGNAECLKILGLFPHLGRSHHDVFEPLLLDMANRGHQLTVVSHFTPKVEPEGWKFINMGNFTHLSQGIVHLNLFPNSSLSIEKLASFMDVFVIISYGVKMCDTITNLPEVKDMVNKNARFDIILVEQFNSDCALGIAHLLDAPVIGLQSHTLMPWTLDKFSQPAFLSYFPNLFLGFRPHMTFWQRVENTINHYAINLIYNRYSSSVEHGIVEKNLNRKIPPLDVIGRNLSLLLINTHYTFHGVKPLVPSIVEVGGIHLKRTLNTLNTVISLFYFVAFM